MTKNRTQKLRKKVSITISSEVLADINRNVRPKGSRSEFIESVLRGYFKERRREALNARDLELINANAEYLNREMEDVDRYQAPIEYSSDDL
jgi:metal-responsive CopG/Arc/MetJ family transcriptional regulator